MGVGARFVQESGTLVFQLPLLWPHLVVGNACQINTQIPRRLFFGVVNVGTLGCHRSTMSRTRAHGAQYALGNSG